MKELREGWSDGEGERERERERKRGARNLLRTKWLPIDLPTNPLSDYVADLRIHVDLLGQQ